MFRILFWIILALVLVLGTLVFCTQAYWESNERKIIDNLPFMNSSHISFGETKISLFKNFPHATVSIKDIALDHTEVQDSSLVINGVNIDLKVNLADWRTKQLGVNEITIDGGSINVNKVSQPYFLNQLIDKINNPSDQSQPAINQLKIDTDNVRINIENLIVGYQDPTKTSLLSGRINYLTILSLADKDNIPINDLDCTIDELTFKKVNGSYLQNASIKTDKLILSRTEGLQIHSTPLKINEHTFICEAYISNSNKESYINLTNTKTNLQRILPLLSQKVSKEIKPYIINGHFPTHTKLRFINNKPVRVEVNFTLLDNDIVIHNQQFDAASLKGSFVNRQNGGKGIELKLFDFKSNRGTFSVESNYININSNPIKKATIDTDITIKGSAEDLNSYYNSDKFILEDGYFELKGHVAGSIKNVHNLLEESNLDLKLRDLNINYKPAQLLIPISSISLIKKANHTAFQIESTTLKSGYPYAIHGEAINLTSLIADYAETTTTSKILLKANRMGWDDFVSVFSKKNKTASSSYKSEADSKTSMKKTLNGINDKFSPKVMIEIDTFDYQDRIQLYDLKTSAYFNDNNLLVLDTTTFLLNQGNITAQSILDLSNPTETAFDIHLNADDINLSKVLPSFDYFNITLLSNLDSLPDDFNLDISLKGKVHDVDGLLPNTLNGHLHFNSKNHENISGDIKFDSRDGIINTTLDVSGNPRLFNEVFSNDEFIFQDAGRFHTSIDHKGDIISFEELIEFSATRLKVQNAEVLYKDVNIVFPLSDLELNIDTDTAQVDLFMYSDILDREIQINGNIDNLSQLLFGKTDKALKTQVDVTSPIINLSHAINIFQYPPETKAITAPTLPIDQKVKKLMRSLFEKFQPDVYVKLDTFIITDKITLTNLNTGCELVDSTYFLLDSTNFDFNGGNVKLNLQVDLSQDTEEPFETQLTTSNLDLQSSLEALGYLGSKNLKEAEVVEGLLDMKLDFKSSLQNLKLITAKNDGQVNFTLSNLKLKGIDVIDDISYKIYSPGIFYDLEFAPLINTVNINGSRIDIPQMEIQSNEVDFFVEGHIDNPDKTNIWLSIPLDNFIRKNKDSIKSRGYDATKRKIYLEISPDKKGKTKTKFRFSKKKFYKQRGLKRKK